jgi:hypothetical protein
MAIILREKKHFFLVDRAMSQHTSQDVNPNKSKQNAEREIDNGFRTSDEFVLPGTVVGTGSGRDFLNACSPEQRLIHIT